MHVHVKTYISNISAKNLSFGNSLNGTELVSRSPGVPRVQTVFRQLELYTSLQDCMINCSNITKPQPVCLFVTTGLLKSDAYSSRAAVKLLPVLYEVLNWR